MGDSMVNRVNPEAPLLKLAEQNSVITEQPSSFRINNGSIARYEA